MERVQEFQERPQPGAEIGEVFQFTQGPGSFGVCRQAWVGLVVEPGLAVDGFAPQGGFQSEDAFGGLRAQGRVERFITVGATQRG